MDRCDALVEASTKTRIVDEVVGTAPDLVTYELDELVERSLAPIRERYPDATLQRDLEADLVVEGDTHLYAAVSDAVENAIIHHDSDEPAVKIEGFRRNGHVELVVSDDGPGIPEQEIRAVSTGEETPLDHASGIGLWLIDWIVRKSEGSVTFQSEENGTDIRIELQTPRDDAA